jgi:Nucleoplasmin-like domain
MHACACISLPESPARFRRLPVIRADAIGVLPCDAAQPITSTFAQVMDHDVEIPDVRFWGLVVHAGKPGTYSIENDHGLLELCHLTNVALVSDSAHQRPIYVRIRSPDDDNEYTLGALVPGKIYSFSTDLMITPDTQFTHTGTERDQVHLTGYRCGSSAIHTP